MAEAPEKAPNLGEDAEEEPAAIQTPQDRPTLTPPSATQSQDPPEQHATLTREMPQTESTKATEPEADGNGPLEGKPPPEANIQSAGNEVVTDGTEEAPAQPVVVYDPPAEQQSTPPSAETESPGPATEGKGKPPPQPNHQSAEAPEQTDGVDDQPAAGSAAKPQAIQERVGGADSPPAANADEEIAVGPDGTPLFPRQPASIHIPTTPSQSGTSVEFVSDSGPSVESGQRAGGSARRTVAPAEQRKTRSPAKSVAVSRPPAITSDESSDDDDDVEVEAPPQCSYKNATPDFNGPRAEYREFEPVENLHSEIKQLHHSRFNCGHRLEDVSKTNDCGRLGGRKPEMSIILEPTRKQLKEHPAHFKLGRSVLVEDPVDQRKDPGTVKAKRLVTRDGDFQEWCGTSGWQYQINYHYYGKKHSEMWVNAHRVFDLEMVPARYHEIKTVPAAPTPQKRGKRTSTGSRRSSQGEPAVSARTVDLWGAKPPLLLKIKGTDQEVITLGRNCFDATLDVVNREAGGDMDYNSFRTIDAEDILEVVETCVGAPSQGPAISGRLPDASSSGSSHAPTTSFTAGSAKRRLSDPSPGTTGVSAKSQQTATSGRGKKTAAPPAPSAADKKERKKEEKARETEAASGRRSDALAELAENRRRGSAAASAQAAEEDLQQLKDKKELKLLEKKVGKGKSATNAEEDAQGDATKKKKTQLTETEVARCKELNEKTLAAKAVANAHRPLPPPPADEVSIHLQALADSAAATARPPLPPPPADETENLNKARDLMRELRALGWNVKGQPEPRLLSTLKSEGHVEVNGVRQTLAELTGASESDEGEEEDAAIETDSQETGASDKCQSPDKSQPVNSQRSAGRPPNQPPAPNSHRPPPANNSANRVPLAVSTSVSASGSLEPAAFSPMADASRDNYPAPPKPRSAAPSPPKPRTSARSPPKTRKPRSSAPPKPRSSARSPPKPRSSAARSKLAAPLCHPVSGLVIRSLVADRKEDGEKSDEDYSDEEAADEFDPHGSDSDEPISVEEPIIVISDDDKPHRNTDAHRPLVSASRSKSETVSPTPPARRVKIEEPKGRRSSPSPRRSRSPMRRTPSSSAKKPKGGRRSSPSSRRSRSPHKPADTYDTYEFDPASHSTLAPPRGQLEPPRGALRSSRDLSTRQPPAGSYIAKFLAATTARSHRSPSRSPSQQLEPPRGALRSDISSARARQRRESPQLAQTSHNTGWNINGDRSPPRSPSQQLEPPRGALRSVKHLSTRQRESPQLAQTSPNGADVSLRSTSRSPSQPLAPRRGARRSLTQTSTARSQRDRRTSRSPSQPTEDEIDEATYTPMIPSTSGQRAARAGRPSFSNQTPSPGSSSPLAVRPSGSSVLSAAELARDAHREATRTHSQAILAKTDFKRGEFGRQATRPKVNGVVPPLFPFVSQHRAAQTRGYRVVMTDDVAERRHLRAQAIGNPLSLPPLDRFNNAHYADINPDTVADYETQQSPMVPEPPCHKTHNCHSSEDMIAYELSKKTFIQELNNPDHQDLQRRRNRRKDTAEKEPTELPKQTDFYNLSELMHPVLRNHLRHALVYANSPINCADPLGAFIYALAVRLYGKHVVLDQDKFKLHAGNFHAIRFSDWRTWHEDGGIDERVSHMVMCGLLLQGRGGMIRESMELVDGALPDYDDVLKFPPTNSRDQRGLPCISGPSLLQVRQEVASAIHKANNAVSNALKGLRAMDHYPPAGTKKPTTPWKHRRRSDSGRTPAEEPRTPADEPRSPAEEPRTPAEEPRTPSEEPRRHSQKAQVEEDVDVERLSDEGDEELMRQIRASHAEKKSARLAEVSRVKKLHPVRESDPEAHQSEANEFLLASQPKKLRKLVKKKTDTSARSHRKPNVLQACYSNEIQAAVSPPSKKPVKNNAKPASSTNHSSDVGSGDESNQSDQSHPIGGYPPPIPAPPTPTLSAKKIKSRTSKGEQNPFKEPPPPGQTKILQFLRPKPTEDGLRYMERAVSDKAPAAASSPTSEGTELLPVSPAERARANQRQAMIDEQYGTTGGREKKAGDWDGHWQRNALAAGREEAARKRKHSDDDRAGEHEASFPATLKNRKVTRTPTTSGPSGDPSLAALPTSAELRLMGKKRKRKNSDCDWETEPTAVFLAKRGTPAARQFAAAVLANSESPAANLPSPFALYAAQTTSKSSGRKAPGSGGHAKSPPGRSEPTTSNMRYKRAPGSSGQATSPPGRTRTASHERASDQWYKKDSVYLSSVVEMEAMAVTMEAHGSGPFATVLRAAHEALVSTIKTFVESDGSTGQKKMLRSSTAATRHSREMAETADLSNEDED